MSSDAVFLQKQGYVSHIILNRPDKHNAMSLAMWHRLSELVDAADNDPDIRVIILRSASDRAFSAGADIEVLKTIANDPEAREGYRLAIRNGQRALRDAGKPTIAMVQGAAVGAGCGLAIHCDMRFAGAGSRFGITPARMGIVYPLSDTRQLVDLVGPGQARKLLYTGNLIGAEEALRIGLIDEMWAEEDLESRTLAFAAQVADASQYSVRHIKQTVARILDGQIDDDEETIRWFLDAHEGEDFAEGVSAFLDRRKPDFHRKG